MRRRRPVQRQHDTPVLDARNQLILRSRTGNAKAFLTDVEGTLLQIVKDVSGLFVRQLAECAVDIREDAYLSAAYIPGAPQRMEMYKKIARIEEYADYEDILDELCDRFGEPPAAAVTLCKAALIRALGVTARMKKIEERDRTLRLVPDEIRPAALTALCAAFPKAQGKMSLGGEAALVCRVPKGERVSDFAVALLTKYLQF